MDCVARQKGDGTLQKLFLATIHCEAQRVSLKQRRTKTWQQPADLIDLKDPSVKEFTTAAAAAPGWMGKMSLRTPPTPEAMRQLSLSHLNPKAKSTLR